MLFELAGVGELGRAEGTSVGGTVEAFFDGIGFGDRGECNGTLTVVVRACSRLSGDHPFDIELPGIVIHIRSTNAGWTAA